jgi:hypothetical protein
MRTFLIVCAIAALAAAGCQSSPSSLPAQPNQSTPTLQDSPAPPTSRQGDAPAGGSDVVAYIRGETVSWSQLRPLLAERAGGGVLTDVVLERQVDERLARRGLSVTSDMIEREKTLMRQSFGDDPDEGQRMIERLRRRQGLGEARYHQMLRRNAGMRLLVQDEVSVGDDQLRQAFDARYGPKYDIRLIVVPSAALASQMVREAGQDRSFVDIVMEHSTDASRAQGGLLTDISPADPTWPDALRRTLSGMAPGQISPPIALDAGFAVVKVESKRQRQSVQFDDVRDELDRRVRRDVERILMQRLARSLLDEADVIVLDAALKRSWDEQRELEP